MSDWLYEGQVFEPALPNIYEGFVYLIENLVNGKRYVGKKHFWTRQKDKKTKRRVTKESDWRDYYSSSDDLKADVALLGKENFRRTILHLCIYKKQMTYLEQMEQWNRNVLLDESYYNTNIGGKFFVRERKILEAKEKTVTTKNNKWREIRSENMKGDKNIAKRDDVRKKLSDKKLGTNHHQYGKAITDEHKTKLHDAAMKSVIKEWLVTTPEGKMLKLMNLNQFCKEKGLSSGHMCNVSKGRLSHHKGYKCQQVFCSEQVE